MIAWLFLFKLTLSCYKRKITVQEVAERTGISHGLVQRIEKGDTQCRLGAVFDVATIVNLKLFHHRNQMG